MLPFVDSTPNLTVRFLGRANYGLESASVVNAVKIFLSKRTGFCKTIFADWRLCPCVACVFLRKNTVIVKSLLMFADTCDGAFDRREFPVAT